MLSNTVDAVFIALHGRPGEDGQVQEYLNTLNIPYNGSGVNSSRTTIDKYKTLQILKQHGFTVAEQLLVYKEEYESAQYATLSKIEAQFLYPFIAKPVDDGCSAAVKVIKNRNQLQAFINQMFRQSEALLEPEREILQLKQKEEFPRKNVVLIEDLITANGAKHFLEITGGLLTHRNGDNVEYELFEPSETLASGEILSLEEKFLAGEGQNITPARYSKNSNDYAPIAAQVKATLERAAKILEVEGYARIDAFVRIFENNRAETVIIEVNSLPGMTPATCIYHQAALNGYKPYDFINQIIDFGMSKSQAT
jgi:D-alanine-D-alanine ligase